MNSLIHRALPSCLLLSISLFYSLRAEEVTYRRDGVNIALPWYQLQTGVFPPADAAHEINGELIELDHINRTGKIRPDRTDAQRRGEWDLPMSFTMLPYGTIRYHGAPAELRDIPIGTHLHGQWFVEPKKEEPKDPRAAPKKNASGSSKTAIEAAFTLVLSFEDDFSHLQRTNRRWRVEAVDLPRTHSRYSASRSILTKLTQSRRCFSSRRRRECGEGGSPLSLRTSPWGRSCS